MRLSSKAGENDRELEEATAAARGAAQPPTSAVVSARLAIGVLVLICAELFSGASLRMGFWHPWTLVVTYWLYFGHFFFFTTLVVRTRRTSLPSLYLWGVLFGLYESWITKVIWSGYSGDGHLVLGNIGPYGLSELSMAFLFHPIASFILPLALTCLFCPPLRRVFPDLAWITGKGKWARGVQVSLIISFAPIMGMNSGGPGNLAANTVFVVVCLVAFLRLGRPAFKFSDGREIVVFTPRGFVGLCLYLGLLYGIAYFQLRPEGLPAVPVQLFTLAFYAVAIVGLWFHRKWDPLPEGGCSVDGAERQLVIRWFIFTLTLALGLSLLRGSPVLYIPIMLIFVVWAALGFVLTTIAIVTGIRRIPPTTDPVDASIIVEQSV